ncbi:hypothetical protein ACU8OH_09225 [Rhizobium leguminosarum]
MAAAAAVAAACRSRHNVTNAIGRMNRAEINRVLMNPNVLAN